MTRDLATLAPVTISMLRGTEAASLPDNDTALALMNALHHLEGRRVRPCNPSQYALRAMSMLGCPARLQQGERMAAADVRKCPGAC